MHCQAGKDRTGAVVAVLLSLVGVPDEVIADDYALTALSLAPLISEWLDGMSSEPAERARLERLADPSREAMLETLAHLRRRHGGAEAYLLAGGRQACRPRAPARPARRAVLKVSRSRS